MNGGKPLTVLQRCLLVVEDSDKELARIAAELTAIERRRVALLTERQAMEDLLRIAEPLIPNPGRMEAEG